MGRVIAVANQKGGVAKTTTAVNLGIGLAREGKRVLLVDTDPQGSLTASLGYVEPDEIPITLANILTAVINEEEVNPSGGILHHEEDIDIMPGNIELSALEVVMGNVNEQGANPEDGYISEYFWHFPPPAHLIPDRILNLCHFGAHYFSMVCRHAFS